MPLGIRSTMTTVNPTSVAIPRMGTTHGMGWRVAVSICSVFGLVSFLLLYLAFWATNFNGAQSAVVVIVSILAFVALNGATWASWGIQHSLPE
ncbi:MAG TPA: hypothetical protein VEY07_05520 [Thermoplasmata archaeon]|nr:hypothetical protein [Thermoplasmata archaeon]